MIRSSTTYPLLDPERYDDEYGEGYAFAAVADDVPEAGIWLADCWIVNRAGEVHPGLDACPVPIRADDLDLANGFETVMPDRKRMSMGWR